MELFLDDRIQSERDERKEMGRDARLPLIHSWIAHCKAIGDTSYRYALQQWIRCVSRRVSRKIERRLLLPDILRKVLGLANQSVILETNDRLWSCVDGAKVILLYDPQLATAA